MFSQRMLFLYGFVLCAALIAVALYFQYAMQLEPCPLCIIQRVFVLGLGAVMLVGALHDPHAWGRRVYGGLITLLAALGVAVAGRHLWLQNLPADQVPLCGPGLEYMLEKYPLGRALELVLKGSGECAEVQWTFLGLSIPGWTLVVFCALLAYGPYLALRRRRPSAEPDAS
ncbi:MAG: disulfide bond formation protein B [Gammaproteobacteria bacterium]|nr:disulfide bond formation protein B [Gammaproteobacteria bacterium]NIR83277.1 disulfide bond formation protein B [Gammaproteobacteria bacterium]NIR91077.1 disulfide bond formation protein B [Gammaproteobacteria bacterium]NIU04444.1 disulfide bond formation protein B [Gammaproteobacteria bacterium]NIW87080.1 disulfide bond formation protein B [Gammaproteobacteria bacterium]